LCYKESAEAVRRGWNAENTRDHRDTAVAQRELCRRALIAGQGVWLPYRILQNVKLLQQAFEWPLRSSAHAPEALAMRRAFQTVIGRFAALSLAVAVIAGAVWSSRTSPWYLVPDQYFITVSPQESVLQRDGKPFDLQYDYQRKQLVSGSIPMPFGVDPDINSRLMQRGLDVGSQLAKFDANFYSKNCGFPDEEGKARFSWRATRLCNTGSLNGDLLQAAVQVFHEIVDNEISQYWFSLAKNAADKIGQTLLAAIAFIGLLAAGMWVARGKLV
jgi:hypothetical protein